MSSTVRGVVVDGLSPLAPRWVFQRAGSAFVLGVRGEERRGHGRILRTGEHDILTDARRSRLYVDNV